MTDLTVSMDSSGSFSFSSGCGRIEEYCAKRLKIKLNTDFQASSIKYYTLSFEPFSLSRKIITENIYRDSSSTKGIYFSNGYIYCPIYDYIAVAPSVMVQVDAYELDSDGNVSAIIKSGIFTLQFSPSLTGEGMMLETVRPDVKFKENVENAVTEILETYEIDGERLKKFSVDGNKLKISTITMAQLQDSCVTSSKIAKNAVKTDTIDEQSVTGEKIADKTIGGEKLKDGSITADKICDKNISGQKIADSSIANIHLSNYCVNEVKIRPNSITTSKISDGSVTPAKLDRAYLTHHQSLAGYATMDWVNQKNFVDDISMKADKTEVPKKLSDLKNDMAISYIKQDLTDSQKLIARINIGAVKAEAGKGLSSNDFTDREKEKLSRALTEHQDISMKADKTELPQKLSDLKNDMAVSYKTQNLTDDEKAIALNNIGAVKTETGKGLSSNDFTDEEKEKLSKALTELSMKADVDSLHEIAFSGSYNDLSDIPDPCGFNDELKINYDKAFNHSNELHAPSDAEKNIIEKISVNGCEAETENETAYISVIGYETKEPVFMEV